MLHRTLPVAAASALALSGAASAGIISFNDSSLFALFASSAGEPEPDGQSPASQQAAREESPDSTGQGGR